MSTSITVEEFELLQSTHEYNFTIQVNWKQMMWKLQRVVDETSNFPIVISEKITWLSSNHSLNISNKELIEILFNSL